MAKGRFGGASEAKVSEKGTKCSDGRHLLEVSRVTYSDSGKNGEYYVVEFKVIESSSETTKAAGQGTNRPGDEVVWTQNMAKKAFPLSKLLGFMYAATGYSYKDAGDKHTFEKNIQPDLETMLDASCDESDSLGLKGRKVWATTKEIKSNGFDFVAYEFAPGQADKLL